MQTAEKRQNTRNDDDDDDKYKDNEEKEQKEEGDNNNKEMEEDKANNKKQNMLSRVPDELERFQKKGKPDDQTKTETVSHIITSDYKQVW